MIVIKTKDFEMVQSSRTGPFFNLSLLTKVNFGKENEREEMKLVSYGLPFEVCMKQIVDIQMQKQTGNMTAREYIERYKVVVNDISQLITYVDKVIEHDHE